MAQTIFTADITAAEFPLLFDWAARTSMHIDYRQAEGKPPVQYPQILYAEDVLPVQAGYKSVSYKSVASAVSPADTAFTTIYTVSDTSQNKALIGVTYDSKIFMLTSASPSWVDVTPASWAGTDAVTTGNANGNYYLYLANKGCYLVNITGVALTPTTLTSITATNILGMFSAVNYLCLWDATGTVYWSSTVNPLDFTPSLITGAGSSIPYDLLGKIVTIVPLNNGFVVYTTVNIVLASFSNNTQYPWIFRNANNGSGILNKQQVSNSHDLGFHIANTFTGVLNVTPSGCTVITPELTDFLASKIYESFNFSTNTVVRQDLDSVVATRLAVVGARYVILSYGIAGNPSITYSDAFVYDLVLQRWGRLNYAHSAIFELETNMEGVPAPYNQASEVGATYSAASPQTYGGSTVTLNSTPPIGHSIGMLQADGTVLVVYLNYTSITDNAVLILGKFQSSRENMVTLQGVAVETIPTTNSGFSLYDMPSVNGKDISAITPLIPLSTGTGVRTYGCRLVGKNHSLLFKGSFNLTTVEITAVIEGRR